jgi:nucleotide-binding universal stress UspA family protein
MTMIKDVLVHADATEGGRSRLRYAFDLAAKHQARLSAVHVIPPVVVPPLYRPSALGRVEQAFERRNIYDAKASEELYRKEAAVHSAESRWKTLSGGVAEHLSEEARHADLVIVGQYESEGSAERHPSSLADDVVVKCGRPLIVLPWNGPEHPKFDHVLCAYDGSREAVRTIHDALPLFQAAGSRIDIVSDLPEEPGKREMTEHIARHRVAVRQWISTFGTPDTHAGLVERLSASTYDLIVMGAYSRPIWRELLFGGTTKSVLIHAARPVLMSH